MLGPHAVGSNTHPAVERASAHLERANAGLCEQGVSLLGVDTNPISSPSSSLARDWFTRMG
ncbi:MAG: hypothetical protein ACRDL4_19840, partial [Thermoleophilaceae bacterium]